MLNQLTITFEGDHIRVIADGDKDFAFAVNLWTQVVAMCQQHNCFNVLGIANTSKPVEAMEGYDHAGLFQNLAITQEYRVAWVELNPDATDMADFIETVLVNRGLPGRVFGRVDDAKTWLLGEAGV